ncbi:MAG: CHAT domain-containing tetratricopeptide repeat protein, partial [Bacteroidota bacterium]
LSISENYRDEYPSRSFYELAYKNLAKAYEDLGDFNKAEKYFLLSYQGHRSKYLAEKESKIFKNRLITSCNSLAIFYGSQNDNYQAYGFLKESLSYHLDKDPMLMDTYKLFGDYFAEIGNPDSAFHYYQKSLNLKKATYSSYSYQIASSHEALGNLAKEQKDWQEALDYYQKAIGNLVLDFEESDPKQNLDIQREQIISSKQLLSVLKSKAAVQYKIFEGNHDLEQLEAAWNSIQKSLALLDIMEIDFQVSEDKYQLESDISSTVEQGIAIAQALYQENGDQTYLNQAFQIAERTKAFLLLDALKASQAREFAGIPADLIEKEHQLRYELLYWEDQWKEALAQHDAEEKQSKAQAKIFELRKAYRALQADFKQYPRYYQASLGKGNIDAYQVQDKLLDKEQALIEYFVGKENSYAFLITKQDIFLKRLDKDIDLDVLKDEFYLQLKRPIDEKGYKYQDKMLFSKQAFQLYQKLFAPLEKLTSLPERLIIVPDIFANISFDALLSAPTKNQEYWMEDAYLFNQYHISYTYSANLLDVMRSQNQNPRFDKFLMVSNTFPEAPIQSLNLGNNLGALTYIPRVMGSIRKHFAADSILEAKKSDFLQTAHEYKYLHIATHGVLNGSQPNDSYLLFAKEGESYGKLYLRELYARKLNASMVVLGACNSGSGMMKSGEGMISMARGFSYAGVASILATLWTVNEVPTAKIISNYYEELGKGNAKDVALGNAKRKYFEEHTGAEFLHPAFWSPIILIGDTRPLQVSRSIWIYVLIIGLIIGATYAVYSWKQTQA